MDDKVSERELNKLGEVVLTHEYQMLDTHYLLQNKGRSPQFWDSLEAS